MHLAIQDNASAAPATVNELTTCYMPLCNCMGRRRYWISVSAHEPGDRPEVIFGIAEGDTLHALSPILT